MKFEIHENNKKKLIISDPLAPSGARAGQYFISFPKTLSLRLPGSVILPNEFVKLNKLNIDNKILISNKLSKSIPILDTTICTTQLRVFHGSLNRKSIKLGKIAASGFDSEDNRAQYQKNIYEIMKPFLKNDKSEYDFWIVEDCLASGDTLIGVLSLLSKNKGIGKVRIDVAVATTIGINLLIEVAEELKIHLYLNIGFLAYALSKGTKKGNARLHANYIVYPDKLLQLISKLNKQIVSNLRLQDGEIYVVGDMGDGAKSMDQKYDGQCPWNKYRDDGYGSRIVKKKLPVKSVPGNKTTMMYFSNGGYLLRSFVKYLEIDALFSERIISAKRVWSDDKKFGYGVLLDGI